MIFGRSYPRKRQRVWRRLAEELGAEFLGRRHQRPDTVQLPVLDTKITLDAGKSSEGVRGTRIRAPFVNPTGFQFLIYTARPFSALGTKLVLLQDLMVGHSGIDRRFVVQSTRPDDVRALFDDEVVRDLVWKHTRKLRLGISDGEGVLGPKYPRGVDLLHYHTPGDIVDPERIKSLFRLFEAILRHVTVPPDEDEVERHVRRLRSPGGIITGRVTLWEGDPPRHDALDHLARLRDARAVETLLETIDDPDPIIQAKAVYALGEIGDERALGTLVSLLGRRQGQLRRKLAEDAGDALSAMGHDDIVDAFEAAMEGKPDGLVGAAKPFRAEVIEALIEALAGPGRLGVSHAVQALSRLGAVEALPALRSRINSSMLAPVREAYREAIEVLEARTSLPRPAAAAPAPAETLPKPADPRDHRGGGPDRDGDPGDG